MIIFILYLVNSNSNESFDNTKLYGSLFLDNLEEQIKQLTNPDIIYDNKTVTINRYSDIIL